MGHPTRFNFFYSGGWLLVSLEILFLWWIRFVRVPSWPPRDPGARFPGDPTAWDYLYPYAGTLFIVAIPLGIALAWIRAPRHPAGDFAHHACTSSASP